MAMVNLQRISDKFIPTTIPCLDSEPSYQPTRAALTDYIVNRRGMAMDSLQQMRDKFIPTRIPCPDLQPSCQWARAALTR